MIDVLHVTPSAFGQGGTWGGGERFAVELARAQAEHRSVRLVTFGARAERRAIGPLEVVVLRRRGVVGNDLNPLSERLLPLLASARVVHLHQWNTLLTSASALCAAALRRSAFVTDHGGDAPNPTARLRPHRRVRALLAVSQYSARLLPEFTGRARVVYAGVDTERFAPPPSHAERAHEVVFVGRLMPHKGLDTLIRAIDGRLTLHVYGRPYDARHRQLLGSLAKNKDVYFHERARDEEIVAAYQRARVAVLPSVDRNERGEPIAKSELFGIVLAEAMACGTPAVCSAVGGMPEVVVDGATGLVVPPRDPVALREALHAICDAPQRRWRELSGAAVERVQAEFTWDRVAKRCFDAYDQLARSGTVR